MKNISQKVHKLEKKTQLTHFSDSVFKRQRTGEIHSINFNRKQKGQEVDSIMLNDTNNKQCYIVLLIKFRQCMQNTNLTAKQNVTAHVSCVFAKKAM
jgi:hypothetical protein